MANAINWFEIPVTDFERAKKFYETVLGISLHEMTMNNIQMGFFPFEEGAGNVSGAICKGEGYVPTDHGTIIYLNADRKLDDFLTRVESAGGKITVPKTLVTDDIGHIAMMIDSEGNSIGFHAPMRK